MTERRVVRVLLAFLVLQTSACYTWRATSTSPAEVVRAEAPLRVRVSVDSARVVIRSPTVVADSLIGESARVAVADVRQLEVRRISWGRTLALYVPLGLATAYAGLFCLAFC